MWLKLSTAAIEAFETHHREKMALREKELVVKEKELKIQKQKLHFEEEARGKSGKWKKQSENSGWKLK